MMGIGLSPTGMNLWLEHHFLPHLLDGPALAPSVVEDQRQLVRYVKA